MFHTSADAESHPPHGGRPVPVPPPSVPSVVARSPRPRPTWVPPWPSKPSDDAAELAEEVAQWAVSQSAMFVQASDANWKDIMTMSHERVVFAQFSADWCGYCKKQIPVMQEFHAADESWMWVMVDTDRTSIKKQYHISGIPVTICFRNGREIDRIVGFKDSSSLRTFIDTHRH